MPRGGNLKNRSVDQAGRVALRAWPKAPKHFTPGEVLAWKRLGVAAMAAGSFSASDLLLAEMLAQLGARHAAAMADPATPERTLVALARLVADLMSRCGLAPQARATVGVLSRPKAKTALDEF
jgi:hypothetical protein